MERALVSGATGFIGRHLVHRLVRSGVAVRAFSRSRFDQSILPGKIEVLEADIRNETSMKYLATDTDTIFHLAGKVHETIRRTDDQGVYDSINVQGTYSLLKGAAAAGVRRFVFFSSVKAMGEAGADHLDESIEPRPITAYGRSKLAAEKLVLDFCKRNGLDAVCLRLPLVYGPGNKGNLSRMISAIDRGIFLPLPVLANKRSLVHVANVVEAAMLAATHPAANGQCYIVTDAGPYSTRELYELICRGLGKRIPCWHMPVWTLKALAHIGDFIGHIRGRHFMFDSDAIEKLLGSAWYSSEKISRELGYRPCMTFEGTLPELITWYRKAQA